MKTRLWDEIDNSPKRRGSNLYFSMKKKMIGMNYIKNMLINKNMCVLILNMIIFFFKKKKKKNIYIYIKGSTRMPVNE